MTTPYTRFGLFFQYPYGGANGDYQEMASRFNFSYGKQSVAHFLYDYNPDGIYAAVASPLVYNDFYYSAGIGPNPVDVNANVPDIRIYLVSDPDVLYVDSPGTLYEGNRIDQGLSAGCDFIINWLDTVILSGTYANQDVGIDGARVQDALDDTKYAVASDFFNAWLYYLGRLNTEYRPARKVIINLGSSSLAQYQSIMALVDGNFFEDVCYPLHWYPSGDQIREGSVYDIWPKRDRVSGCWIWTGCRKNGYGQVRVNKILYMTHRFMYAWLIKPIPNGKGKHIPVLDHLCDNRSCCNPAHLQLLDDRENILKGNGATAKKFRQTHCKNGHLLPEPIRGHRRCMICHRAWNRRRYELHLAELRERRLKFK